MTSALKIIGIVFGACVALVVLLYFGTRGTYPVAALVTDNPELPAATVGGVDLHLRRIDGPTGAPTIVTLHGGPGGDFRSLLPLEALAKTHTVVFYDQRGAGLSQRVPRDQLSLESYIAELDGIIDLVSPETPVILIGHSWGAMLATAYLGQHPERVERAVLIEPGYLDSAGKLAWDAEARGYMSGLSYWKKAILAGARAQHVNGPDSSAPDDFLIGHMVGVFANHPQNPYHCGNGYTSPSWRFGALASQVWNTSHKSEVDRLAANALAFEGRVLLLAGACNDWLGPLQVFHQSLFAKSDFETIPNAGHDVVWDNPTAALATIRRFLNLADEHGANDE